MQTVKVSDLPPDLRRKLLGDVKKAAPKDAENEGQNLFAFQIKAMKLPPAVQQFKFAESMGRKFTADFAWHPEYRLLVEINGGVWMKGGAHSMPTHIERDMVKLQHATLLGFSMLAFTPDDVFSGHAVDWTAKTLERLGWKR
jgi:hypothetical protein